MDSKITVDVYFSGRNFSAQVPVLSGCAAAGGTPKQLSRQMLEAVDVHVKNSIDDGDFIPVVFKGAYELIFKYDTKGLLNYYKNIFTKTALHRLTGINSKQLYHYASGVKKPRRAQIEKCVS